MARGVLLLLGLLAAWTGWTSTAAAGTEPIVATYSIVAANLETGELGVAVQSKFFGVGSVVPWAKAGVGAIATQANANTSYGTNGLALLASGKSAAETIQLLTAADPRREERQLAIVDAHGNAAAHTGSNCLAWAGQRVGLHYSVQGNILASEAVVEAMTNAFEQARLKGTPLPEAMVAALQAAETAGGDRRGRQSAALLVVRPHSGFDGATDRYIDLHVEDHPQPVDELSRLLRMHRDFYGNGAQSLPSTTPTVALTVPLLAEVTMPSEGRHAAYWLTGLAVAVIALLFFAARAPRPSNLGVKEGRLAVCSNSACVSSQAETPVHQVDPIRFNDNLVTTVARLKGIIASMSRQKLITETPDYLHLEFTTLFFRSTDDVEFFFDTASQRIEIRSASRIGLTDFGRNRRRVEAIRKAWTTPASV